VRHRQRLGRREFKDYGRASRNSSRLAPLTAISADLESATLTNPLAAILKRRRTFADRRAKAVGDILAESEKSGVIGAGFHQARANAGAMPRKTAILSLSVLRRLVFR
jgi:hypothetical protein